MRVDTPASVGLTETPDCLPRRRSFVGLLRTSYVAGHAAIFKGVVPRVGRAHPQTATLVGCRIMKTMRICTLFLLSITLLAGCSSVRDVRTTNQTTIDASRVNEATSGRLARVQMRDGEKVYGVGVRVAPDSTSWVDPQSVTYVTVGTEDVGRITIIKAGQGALVGLGVGAVIGIASGIVRAQVEGDDPEGVSPSLTKGEKMTVFPLAHSAYAALVTTPLGAIIGRKASYRIVPSEQLEPGLARTAR